MHISDESFASTLLRVNIADAENVTQDLEFDTLHGLVKLFTVKFDDNSRAYSLGLGLLSFNNNIETQDCASMTCLTTRDDPFLSSN